MKKVLKIFLIIVGSIIFLVSALVLALIWASKQPAVKDNYFKNIQTSEPLEQKYINKGGF